MLVLVLIVQKSTISKVEVPHPTCCGMLRWHMPHATCTNFLCKAVDLINYSVPHPKTDVIILLIVYIIKNENTLRL